MKTDREGAGDRRLPRPAALGRFDRLSLASAGVPFPVKLAAVWVVIFGVLAVLLSLLDFDWPWIGDHWVYISKGTTYTVVIAVAAIVLAITLALIGSLGRISRNPIAFGVSGFYTSFFRGTPLILQLFIIYQAFPQIGAATGNQTIQDLLTMEAVPAGILGLGLNYGAYMTEIFRAGIQSVGHAQSEAADALGMTYPQKMRRVVLPQAVRVIIPPTGNEFIAMMKDTALVSFLGITAQQAEIFRRAQLQSRADFRFLEGLLIAAVLYWILTSIFSYFQGRLERRLSRGYVRTVSLPVKAKMFSAADRASAAEIIGSDLQAGAGPAPPDASPDDEGGGPGP